MSQYQFGGQVYISDNLDATTSNSSNYFVSVQGDTIRILQSRTVTNSSDAGYTGEICFDSDYIYYCISGDGSTGTWKRVALSTW
jgi:hypothetical protein